MVDGAKRTDKTAKDPAEKKGHTDQAQGPGKTFDPFMAADECCETDKRIKLKEKGDGLP